MQIFHNFEQILSTDLANRESGMRGKADECLE